MKDSKGFTLVELLAVIAILGIIMSIVAVSVSGVLNDSEDDIDKIQIKAIKKAAKSYVADNIYICKRGCNVSLQDLISGGYLDNSDNLPEGSVKVIKSGNNFKYYIDFKLNNASVGDIITKFSYNGTNGTDGSIQTYTIPETGNYIIEAAGAEGTTGNNYSYTGTPLKGGKGAKINANFSLVAGDKLIIVVGGQGSITQATARDGTSGAGGGGSFVFKKITSITDSTYQITKNSENLEVLLVAAGGGGSTDNSYRGTNAQAGKDGIGDTWISPGGSAYSTTTNAGTSSSTSVLGISQFITYNSIGAYYTRASGICRGGFGGGSCADDSQSYGGGWNGSSYAANSFSSGNNTNGVTGYQNGHGYVMIVKE